MAVYKATLQQVQELIGIQVKFEEIVRSIMMTQCINECPYGDCRLDEKKPRRKRKAKGASK